MTRKQKRLSLILGGLAVLGLSAAACGTASTSTSGGGGGGSAAPSGSSASGALAGKPIENMLEIFNWSEYDDPSTYAKFKKLPDALPTLLPAASATVRTARGLVGCAWSATPLAGAASEGFKTMVQPAAIP